MGKKVAAIQMVSSAHLDENLQSAARLIAEASAAGAALVLLPEVFAVLEGGPMRPFGEKEGTGPIQEFLSAQARKHELILVGGTIPLITRPGRKPKDPDYFVDDERVRPASLVYDASGAQIARYDKIHLFDVVVADKQASYSESRSYEAGNEVVTADTALGRLGLTVCYDLRFPELYRELFSHQVDMVTVPAAFTRVTGEAHWETLLRARAIENQCYVIAAGQGGKHNEKRETWGHSMIIDPWGTVLDEIDQGEGFAIAEIDLEFVDSVRKRMPISQQRKL
ncbi:MAG: carbon-nitrogen hydrolase family protein [Proteobacteria bacterium]|nr:carbon-nitrogen hydrolase family protein [Pseudomonadota bacterium]MDA0926702.1 carbon-nitrogen hydrolase family protein [Pseudomonadota bacterium]